MRHREQYPPVYPRVALHTALACLAVLYPGGCKDDPPEDMVYDFSGSVVDLAVTPSGGDAAVANPDLAGYDLSCDPLAPLGGGDPTGPWQYYAACASADAFFQLQAGCPAMQVDAVKLTNPSGPGAASGSLSLNPNGTFSRSSRAVLQAKAIVPSGCVQAFGDCKGYETGQGAQFNWLTISCQPAGTSCSCAVSADVSKTESGTWTKDASGFTTTGTLGGPQAFTASAAGNTLRHHGSTSTLRGNRGITYVLIR